MRKIRIGFITTNLNITSGVTRWWLTLCKYFDAPDCTWSGTAITTNPVDAEGAKAVNRYMPVGLPMEQVVEESDVVLVWGRYDLGKLRPKIPVIYVNHATGIAAPGWVVRQERIAITHWAAVSEAAASCLRQPKVKVIYPPCDISRLAGPSNRNALLSALNLPARPGIKIIGYFGAHRPEKCPERLPLLLDALGPDYYGLYVGVNRIADIHHRIRLVPFCETVGKYYAISDAVFLPSRSEACSLVAAETWIAGKPLICRPTGAIPELTKMFGEICFISAGETIEADVAATHCALSDQNRPVIERAGRMARAVFDPVAVATQWANYIREVVGVTEPQPAEVVHRTPPEPVTLQLLTTANVPAIHAKPAIPRLAIITPGLGLGGAERWIASLVRHIDRKRLNICEILVEPGGQLHPLIYDAVKSATNVSLEQPGVTKSRLNSYDGILTWSSPRLPEYVAGLRKLPVILTSHTSRREVLSRLEPFATHLAAVSRVAIAAFGAETNKTATILHNGADIERCVPLRSRAAARAALGLAPTDIAIGHVSRLSPEKNPLAAAKAVAALGSNYKAVYAAALTNATHHEIKNEIRDIAGKQAVFIEPVEHVGELLQALDIFLLASPAEAFSLSLTEAWLCGTKTVATRVGAIPELEAKFGQLVVPLPVGATAEQLAGQIETALSMDTTMTQHAHQIAWQNYTAQAMAQRWTDYLVELI